MQIIVVQGLDELMALTDDWEFGGESKPMEPQPYVAPKPHCLTGNGPGGKCWCLHPDGECTCLPF
jgi:hypothetical protein